MTLSRRAYHSLTSAASWEEVWEAGSYYQRIAELLEDARHFAVFVGWQVDSRLPMKKPERPGQALGIESLKEKVIRLCNKNPDLQIYFLMWDHAYFYCLEREPLQGRIWEDIHPNVHFVFDNRHPLGGSHHEKLAIVDGRVGFCGGIDLCDERWDSRHHFFKDPRRSLSGREENHGPYHDLAVQVTGVVCSELLQHIGSRWRKLSVVPFPYPATRGSPHLESGHRVYFSRTVAGIDSGDRGRPLVREIEFLFRDLIGLAQKRIILEGQYYWSKTFNDLLIAKMEQMRGHGLEVILILADFGGFNPFVRMMSRHELILLERLHIAADRTGTRLIAGNPWVGPDADPGTGDRAKSVYVHSKLLIIDDRFLSIGSANFSARALRVDTEVALTLEATRESERSHIDRVSERVLKHWNILPSSETSAYLRPFKPKQQIAEIASKNPILSKVPWEKYFDPELPYFYLIKRRYLKFIKTGSRWIPATLTILWLLGLFIALLLGRAFDSTWETLYGVYLGSSWILPLPFVPVSLLASAHLGMDRAFPIILAAGWTSSILGYLLTRIFPTPAYRMLSPDTFPRVLERLKRRTFASTLYVSFDPRLSLRSKIALQGLSYIPFPWFLLANLIVLPGLIYALCWAWSRLTAEMPAGFSHFLTENAGIILGLFIAITLIQTLWRTDGVQAPATKP